MTATVQVTVNGGRVEVVVFSGLFKDERVRLWGSSDGRELVREEVDGRAQHHWVDSPAQERIFRAYWDELTDLDGLERRVATAAVMAFREAKLREM